MDMLKPYMSALNRSPGEDEFTRFNIVHMEDSVGMKDLLTQRMEQFRKEAGETKFFALGLLASFRKCHAFTGLLFRDRECAELWVLRERILAMEREEWIVVDCLGELFKYKMN